jgi:hypothetical protein
MRYKQHHHTQHNCKIDDNGNENNDSGKDSKEEESKNEIYSVQLCELSQLRIADRQ